MSHDLLLATECTHRVVAERHFLSSDRKTARFNRSPSSTNGITVSVNRYEVSPNHRLFGYHFEDDPTKLDNPPMLVFNRDLQDGNPLLELTYPVSNVNCRRCGGSKKEYDPKQGPRGEYKQVRNELKLAQMIEKWELTIKGSNAWQTRLGMTLIEMIGSKGSDQSMIQSILTTEFGSMEDLIRLIQKRQSRYQIVTTRELLDFISQLQISQDEIDPRLWGVFVQFETVDGTVGTVNMFFRGGKASDRFLNPTTTS